MLEAHGIAFRYEKNRPLLFQGIDLTLKPGEIIGLPGPSGSGKSTLAKILAGYLTPLQGDVQVEGNPLKKNTFNHVQILFQHPELAVNPRWKIKNVLAEAGPASPGLLNDLSIDETWMERYPHELSGGELQRICLARALNPGTRYLLCDEMTSMLDALTQAVIWKAVLGIAEKRNLGLLVISHDAALISIICHRTLDYFIQPG
jgi:ABC-type dipeptide/oligopeptide/nickel transport system ATPase subunit